MFQSPLGGISFVFNLIIVIIGLAVNKMRHRKLDHPLITQRHIDRMHSTRSGNFVSGTLIYIIPIVLFLGVSTVSLSYVKFFYNDGDKVTLTDAYSYSKDPASYQAIIQNSYDGKRLAYNKIENIIESNNFKMMQRKILMIQDTITSIAVESFPGITNNLAKK